MVAIRSHKRGRLMRLATLWSRVCISVLCLRDSDFVCSCALPLLICLFYMVFGLAAAFINAFAVFTNLARNCFLDHVPATTRGAMLALSTYQLMKKHLVGKEIVFVLVVAAEMPEYRWVLRCPQSAAGGQCNPHLSFLQTHALMRAVASVCIQMRIVCDLRLCFCRGACRGMLE